MLLPDLTPTSAMILGSPGRPNEDWAQSEFLTK